VNGLPPCTLLLEFFRQELVLFNKASKKKNDSLVKLQNKVGEFQNHFLIPEGDLGDKEVIEGEGKMRIRL
jgi:hypothetical protein